MASFFRGTRLWSVDFTYEGRPRRWLRTLPREVEDGPGAFAAELEDLYGSHAALVSARPATPEEESDYVRGELPRNAYCPTLRKP